MSEPGSAAPLYHCENDACPDAYVKEHLLKHGEPADCPTCGWSMAGV